MKKNQIQLTLTILAATLFLLVLTALSAIGGFALGRGAAGVLVTAARVAGGLAALGLLAAAASIGWQAVLQPAGRWQRFLNISPLYSLGLLLVGIGLAILGIGTVGAFTASWLALSGLATVITVLAAAARLELTAQTLRRTATALGVTGGLGLAAWLAMLVAVVLGVINPPARGNFGGGPGGPDGGPGGRGFSTLPLIVGAIALSLFALAALFLIWQLWRARPAAATAASGFLVRSELRPAALSGAILTAALLLVSQVIPVARANPPVQTTINWDSPKSQQLFTNACADCHSNETKWPWYAYVAPGSWLLASHVSAGRDRWNLSDLSALRSFQRDSLPDQVQRNISTGAMPPADYLLMHPEARLSEADKQQLTQSLQSILAQLP